MGVEVDGRRQRSVVTRAAIIDAAENLFSTQGFHDTSLRSIAAHAGLSHSGLLKHFGSKGELLLAVLQKVDAHVDVFALAPPDLPRTEILRLLASYTMRQTVAVNLRVLLLGEAAVPSHPAHAFVRDQLELVELDLGVALEADGADLLALWNGLQLICRYVPSLDPVQVAVSAVSGALPAGARPSARVTTPRRRARSEAPSRDQEIIAAATEAFAANGFRSTSLRDIASRLGLSHGTVLYHFPTKLDLLTAVLDARDRDEVLAWTPDQSPLDYLNGLYLQALDDERDPGLSRLFSILVCEATDGAHPAHAYFASRYVAFHAELSRMLAALVADGTARAEIDPELEAWTLIALWDGLALRSFYRTMPGELPERLLGRINSLLTVKLDHASVTTG